MKLQAYPTAADRINDSPADVGGSPVVWVLLPVAPYPGGFATNIIGRGLLGRWGPNFAADPIVTRWIWVQIGFRFGFRLGSDWVQIGFRFGSVRG